MASEQPKQPKAEIADESDRGLDRAIDDLRGVLKKDAEGLSEIENVKAGDDKMGAGTDRAKALETDPRADFAADDEVGAFHPSPLGAAGDALFSGAPTFDDEDGGAAAPFGPDSGAAALLGARITDAQAASPRRRRDDEPANLDLIMDIPIDMEIVLGKSRLPVSGLMALGEGSLIALDRKIGEPVEIMVNGRLFGHGEITVLEGDETRFGVKLIEILGGMKN